MSAAENIRFQKMLSEADCEKISAVLFSHGCSAESLKVVRVNDSAVRFTKRLNNFYYQFQAIGNNYNQVVHAINWDLLNSRRGCCWPVWSNKTRDLKRLERANSRACQRV